MKILHVITGLDTGGAEMMLMKVVERLDRARFSSRVVSLSHEMGLADRVREAGVDVTTLNVVPKLAAGPRTIRRVSALIRETRPDVIQTWMYHADLVGGIAGRIAGVPVIWNIQSSTLDPVLTRCRTRVIARVSAVMSKVLPSAIISCSNAGLEVHSRMGYARDLFEIIPNGTDLSVFRPDPEGRAAMRRQLGVSAETRLVGMIARLHSQKDHPNFFAAAGLLARTHSNARFVLVGLGLEPHNPEVLNMARNAGVEERTTLLGLRSDMASLLPALDIHTLSSAYGEGFPNVIGEAMAAGVPCVVTRVGDSAEIVGDTGFAVPPRDPQALANAWRQMLDLDGDEFEKLRVRARQRVADHFSLEASISQYEALYERVGT